MSPEANDFFKKLLAVEGDVFTRGTLELYKLKQLFVELNHMAVVQLKRHTPLSEAFQVVAHVSNTGIGFDWLDHDIKTIRRVRELKLQFKTIGPGGGVISSSD